MAQIRIELHRHPQGEVALYRISLVSDEDATPSEHERNHRRAVQSLFPGIDLDVENTPRIRVEREKAPDPQLPCSCDDDGYEVIDLG